jgi:opacity protein-like surface antigen
LVLATSSVGAQAKTTTLLGIGANFAASDYGDADSAKTGYQLMAGYERSFMKSLSIRVDGSVSWQARKTIYRESTYLAGANARLVYWTPKVSALQPYLLGGFGLLYNKYTPGQSINHPHSEAEMVYGVGAGSEFAVGPATAFLEARYDYGADLTRIYPLVLGVRFSQGGK